VILFDFGGTLDADGVRWSRRFHIAYLAAGGGLPFSDFEPLFQQTDRLLAQRPGIAQTGFRAMLEAQGELLARLLADRGDSAAPAALAASVHRSSVAVVARNRGVLGRLTRDHRLGIVANFTGNLDVCLAELGLAPLFDVVIDSANVGMTKPDPGIFRLALRSLEAEPGECWMVGDNPGADLMPAAALGMRTCWLAPADDRRLLPGGVPTARIASLPELPHVLELSCTA
jgi:FMN phosphatase YigB (HAD superfamily)